MAKKMKTKEVINLYQALGETLKVKHNRRVEVTSRNN
jgi:hypothetical protein